MAAIGYVEQADGTHNYWAAVPAVKEGTKVSTHRGMKFWQTTDNSWVVEDSVYNRYRTGWQCICHIDEVRAP